MLLCLAAALGSAQQPQSDQKELNQMLDEIRAAIRAGDWPEASRISIRLNAALLMLRTRSQATPSLELEHLEMLGGKDPMTRNPLLARMTKAAFAAGDWARARRYADEALEAAKHGVFWWTGDAIHQGNLVLGRLAVECGGGETLSAGGGKDARQRIAFLPRSGNGAGAGPSGKGRDGDGGCLSRRVPKFLGRQSRETAGVAGAGSRRFAAGFRREFRVLGARFA
jgi:hypothetical protein